MRADRRGSATVRPPAKNQAMQIRVITLRYNEALQGFPEEVLRAATFGREVLNENNNGFRLVSTMSEQTGFHFDTPALRGYGDEHAPSRSTSNASDRRAGTFSTGGMISCERH